MSSPNPNVFKNTFNDLKYHADLLDLVGHKNSVMVVHGGGIYGNKKKSKEDWCINFNRLPENVKNKLVLENCEKNFNIEDCLEISKKINIPVVFDTHHFECYKLLHPKETFKKPECYMSLILETWNRRNIKPKFHVSEQGAGRCGHHSDFIEEIPQYLLDIPKKNIILI